MLDDEVDQFGILSDCLGEQGITVSTAGSALSRSANPQRYNAYRSGRRPQDHTITTGAYKIITTLDVYAPLPEADRKAADAIGGCFRNYLVSRALIPPFSPKRSDWKVRLTWWG